MAAHNKGVKRPQVEVAKSRLGQLKTGLRNKTAKHQKEIEDQIAKIRKAEIELEALLEKERK